MTVEYRRCVGMMIINENNEILVGRRLDHPSGYWQMPQGGIDENENPNEAVWREMQEEIGTNNATMIKKSKQWAGYAKKFGLPLIGVDDKKIDTKNLKGDGRFLVDGAVS